MLVSVIIPTLNEAARVEALAASVCALPEAECIFADGGSTDGTWEKLEAISKRFENCRKTQSERGRGKQMNAGAKLARGEWLLFLHADTELPAASYKDFRSIVVQNSSIHSGAFSFRVAHERKVYRYLEWYVQQRCRFLKLPFGDQCIFTRRDFFEKLNGFREDFPLMEDMEFVQRANKYQGFRVLEVPVFTSARRYEQEGYWKRAAGNVYLQTLYRLGVHPQRLANKYYR